MPKPIESGYSQNLSFNEALTIYLDNIKKPVAGLNEMLDDPCPEGCVLYGQLLAIQEATTKAIQWYLR